MAPLRLLYLHNQDITSVSANMVQVISMCNAWHSAGYDTTLVLRSYGMTTESGTLLLQEQLGLNPGVSVRLIRQKLPRRISRYTCILYLRRVIRSSLPDFCFVRDPLFFRLIVGMGIPTIFEFHNNRMHHGSRILNRWFTKGVVLAGRSASTVALISISKELAKWWSDAGIPPEKITTLHDGFAHEMFIQPKTKAEAREIFRLPGDRKIVVYTGNLQVNRGIHYIIEIATLNPQLLFVLAGGKASDRERVEEECRSSGIDNIRFLGQLPHAEVPSLLNSADVLLAMWSAEVPTIRYCSPLKVFEYMASGRPAVYPAYPTIREVIQDGVNGFLGEPDDVPLLNVALHRALSMTEEERKAYAESSKNIAFQNYTWTSRVETIRRLLPDNLRTA
jgi:glycosyltransferase involved in cell wall biosynthesis